MVKGGEHAWLRWLEEDKEFIKKIKSRGEVQLVFKKPNQSSKNATDKEKKIQTKRMES